MGKRQSRLAPHQTHDEFGVRPAIDVLPQQIFVFDSDWRPLFANRRGLEYTGLTTQESQSKDAVARIFHPEDLKKLELLREGARVDRAPFEMEARIRGKDGKYRWFLIQDNPLLDEQGRVLRWYGTRTNLDGRKRGEKEMHKLVSLVENSRDFIGFASLEGEVLFVNPAGQAVIGLAGNEQVRETKIPDYIAEQNLQRFQNEVLPAVFRDGRWEGETLFKHFRTGASIPMWQHIFFITEEGSERPLALATICRDITERKHGEEEMRKLASLVENGTDFIGMATLEGRVLFINPAGQTIVGLAGSEQARRTKIPDYYAEQDLERFMNVVLPIVFRDGRWEGETLFKHFQTGTCIPMWQHVFFITEEGSGRRLALATICRDITERKQAEGALRRSERQLRDVIETIPAMAWTSSPDGGNDFVNGKWLEYTGMTVEDSLGDGWKSTIHPSDREAHCKLWSESLVTGKPFENEARWLRAEHGEYRWFLFRAVPLLNEFGQIVKWYGTGTDIEDRKRAEHTLLVSEARFAEAQRLGHTGSWAWNRVTNHTYWSEEMFRIYGFPLETTPSRELLQQHVHPDDLAIVEAVADLLPTKERAVYDFRLLLPDNSLKYIHSVAQAVKDVNGQVIEFQGTAIDVTELRRAEQELQQLVDLVPQVIVVLEADGTFIHANQFAQEYTGLTFDKCPYKDLVTRIIHPEDELKTRSVRERSLQGTEPFGLEVRLRGKDGVYRWFLFRYNPLVEGGRARRWYASATEIESRKQEEERVRKENVRLEERTRIARELHDTLLQTFQVALLKLGAATNRLPPDSQFKSRLDPILEFMQTGITEGRNAIQGLRSSGSRPSNLVVALSAVHEEFSDQLGVDFRVDVAGQQQPLRSATQDEIYRIGREALVNAFCHSGATRIHLELEYTDSSLIIRIRDNGCGIDPRILNAGRDGHWGLAGMRERATKIGGLLEISSGATGGTGVQLSVSGSVAFQR